MRLTARARHAISILRPHQTPPSSIGMPMEDSLNAGEVLRQASAVVGRPVILWEVTGAHDVVARASSDPDATASLPKFDLEKTLRRWNVAIPVGSRWVASPGATPDAWVIAPVRSRPPAPPPGGRERRSRERLALELAGLALGLIGSPAQDATGVPSGMLAHQASNPLTAARAGLQLAMESIGRWVDLAADRRAVQLGQKGKDLLIIVHGRGTAANLAKVRSVAETTFGGSVAVESALATGTTFTIALPLPPQRQP